MSCGVVQLYLYPAALGSTERTSYPEPVTAIATQHLTSPRPANAFLLSLIRWSHKFSKCDGNNDWVVVLVLSIFCLGIIN